MAVIDIDDEGPGLPPGEEARVFEPFYRLERSRSRETGGTGLGLSVARSIARLHGGDVVLTNRAGKGLRARVTIPITN
jgi:signal transduction histidine kinase